MSKVPLNPPPLCPSCTNKLELFAMAQQLIDMCENVEDKIIEPLARQSLMEARNQFVLISQRIEDA